MALLLHNETKKSEAYLNIPWNEEKKKLHQKVDDLCVLALVNNKDVSGAKVKGNVKPKKKSKPHKKTQMGAFSIGWLNQDV